MSLSFPRTPLQVIAAEIQAAVGREAFNWAVREAENQGLRANAALRRAINSFRFGSRGPVNYRNRKRDISGGIKPIKLNFDDPKYAMSSEDVNFKRSKMTIGGTRKRTANDLFKAEVGSMEELVWRWQACSASLLGPGRLPIGFGTDNASFPNINCLPFHMMSLTNNPGLPENASFGCSKAGMFRYYFDKSSGNMGYSFLKSQQADGAVTQPFPGWWTLEKGLAQNHTGQIFHKYTDIRINLYGSTLYPLKYKVMLVTKLPLEMSPLDRGVMANPITIPGNDFTLLNNTPLSQFILDHVRPLVTNPIIGSNSDEDYKGKFRVVSQKTYHIPCLTYGNAAAEAGNSAVNSTNVHNVNMFVRHDRYRDYKWHQLSTDVVRTNNPGGVGFDVIDTAVNDAGDTLCDVDREERLYLVISCDTGALINNSDYLPTGPFCGPDGDTIGAHQVSGSYDIVVRNCFRQQEIPQV